MVETIHDQFLKEWIGLASEAQHKLDFENMYCKIDNISLYVFCFSRPISDKMTTSDKDTLVIKRGLIKTHLDTQKAYITIFWASEALYIIGFKNVFDVFLINLKSSICFFAFQDQSLTK